MYLNILLGEVAVAGGFFPEFRVVTIPHLFLNCYQKGGQAMIGYLIRVYLLGLNQMLTRIPAGPRPSATHVVSTSKQKS